MCINCCSEVFSLFKEFLTHSSLKCEYLCKMKGFFSGFVAVTMFNFRGFKLTDVNYLKPCAASFNCMRCERCLLLERSGENHLVCACLKVRRQIFNFTKVVIMMVGFFNIYFLSQLEH